MSFLFFADVNYETIFIAPAGQDFATKRACCDEAKLSLV